MSFYFIKDILQDYTSIKTLSLSIKCRNLDRLISKVDLKYKNVEI